LRSHQALVEHDEVIGPVDLVVVEDGRPVDAGIGLHRGAGALAAVVAEGLHRKAHLGVERRDELGAGDAALAAASVHAHFERQRQAFGNGGGLGRKNGRILGVHQVSRLAVWSGV